MSENLFPYTCPSDVEALADFAELQKVDGKSFIKHGEWFSRSEFDTTKVQNTYIDAPSIGAKASDRHTFYARMACDSINSPSPIRSWYQEKHRKTLENCKFFEDNPKTALALRKYVASQFKPCAAVALYDMFNATSIYDPCGGWGDRMVAAMAKNKDYHCRDVNPLVIAGYSGIQKMYEHTSRLSFEYQGSEVDDLEGSYDFIFTSPPYWKAEKYQGEFSSFKQYKSFPEWMDKFLFTMIFVSMQRLSSGGVMALNVSDIYANHTVNKIVQPIIETFSHFSPYVIGYKMAKRANSKSENEGVFCEPIIILRK